MQKYTVKEALENEREILEAVISGKIFVYPTDTVYGIGCNAFNEESVRKIYEIKKAPLKPMSVIAPSKKWIHDNTDANEKAVSRFLPGKFTLIANKKESCRLPKIVSAGKKTIGVRIPSDEFTTVLQQSNLPFITTSANISGEMAPSSLDEIPSEILEQADIVIDGGKLDGQPSTILDLTTHQILTIRGTSP